MGGLVTIAIALIPSDSIELIEVSATWCAPCRQQAPIISRLESEGLRVHHVDFDKQRAIAEVWQVQSVPTSIFVRGGHELKRVSGFVSYENIRNILVQLTSATHQQPSWSEESFLRYQADYGGVVRWWMYSLLRASIDRSSSLVAPNASSAEPLVYGARDPPQPAVIDVPALALACHVRIRVDEGGSRTWASGTIVNYGNGKCDIITNKHVTGSRGGRIAIDDGTGYWQGVRCREVWPKGNRIPADDLAFVVADKIPPASAALCGEGYKPVEPLYMVGNPGGELPRIRKVTILKRWTARDGGHHLSLSAHTLDGDSGGGVYDSMGILVGVIWGDDPKGGGGLAVDLSRTKSIAKATREKSQSRAKVELSHELGSVAMPETALLSSRGATNESR